MDDWIVDISLIGLDLPPTEIITIVGKREEDEMDKKSD